MKLHSRAVFIYLFLLILACNKEKQHAILLRVENTTAKSIADVIVGNYNFGSIATGAVTNYKACEDIVAYQTVSSFKINDSLIYPYAIAIDPPLAPVPPPAFLKKGNYTIIIYYDSINAMYYRTKLIKD